MTGPPPPNSDDSTRLKANVLRASEMPGPRALGRAKTARVTSGEVPTLEPQPLSRARTTRFNKTIFTKPTTDAVQSLTKPQVTDHDFQSSMGVVLPARFCGLEPIHPHSTFMRNWDVLSIVLLFYTAVMTPFETAFLTPGFGTLFALNTFVDVCFFLDMLLRFFLVYFDANNNMWITDAKLIVYHYLRGWFLIDLVSVLPFNTIGLMVTAPGLGRLRFTRILRLFRLMKVVRVVQDASVFRYWEVKMSMNYATLSLAKFCFFVFMIAHWIACMFRAVADFETNLDANGNRYNWLTVHYMGTDALIDCEVLVQYVTALYWSVMTLTTIGYGDVGPATPSERALSIVCMVLGGGTYAYVVGGVCRILSAMDAATSEFHQTIDTLNEFCRHNRLPSDLSSRLRDFFFSSRSLLREKKNRDLLLAMSPGLRGEVALYNNQWISKIDFFSCSDDRERSQFITALAMVLRPECFPPSEAVIREGEYNTKMYLVERGFATRGKVMVGAGSFFGEDIILTYRQRNVPVRAFTYLHVQILTKFDLEDILSSGLYPEILRNIRGKVLKTAFKNNFVRLTEKMATMRRMDTLRQLSCSVATPSSPEAANGPRPSMLSQPTSTKTAQAPADVHAGNHGNAVATCIKSSRSETLSEIGDRLDMILKRIAAVESAVLGDGAALPLPRPLPTTSDTMSIRGPPVREHDPSLSYRTAAFSSRHRGSLDLSLV